MTVTQSRIDGSREGLPDTDVDSLPPDLSARQLLSRGQLLTLIALLGCVATLVCVHVLVGVGPSLLWWGQLGVGAVTAVYIVVISFKLVLILAAHGARTIELADSDLHRTSDAQLPGYTVLVPLHREGKVLRALVERLNGLDYPRDRLQILLLVEEDDDETRTVLDTVRLGPQFEVVVIPPSHPRTKPKACNLGLARARGELCVIYDAEDRPETDQLRKAAAAFRQLPDWEVCVQAELQYWNPWTNWLTRCFAAEYAVNFGLVLRGLDRLRLPIPLGGTSNHFRADALRALGGWDPHNVTEDADLGIRIARRGWGVRMMTSVTEEEANSHLGNWLRQRSRWIKGYVQTWLVHMRSPVRLWRELGTRRFLAFQLTVGFSTFTALVNPIFWLLTVLYLLTGPERIQALFPPLVLYLGLASMVIGNLLIVYYLMIGCMERGLHRAVRTMLSVPLYWALMSAAAYKAVGQLLRPSRRHYWELTRHGLVGDGLEAFRVFDVALDEHHILPPQAMIPETRDRPIVAADALTRILEAPVLASLPSVLGHTALPADAALAARLQRAAASAGVHVIQLTSAGPPIDLAHLAATLRAETLGVLHVVAVPTPWEGRASLPRGAGTAEDAQLDRPAVPTAIVLVTPSIVKPSDLDPPGHLLAMTGWPLLGVVTYEHGRGHECMVRGQATARAAACEPAPKVPVGTMAASSSRGTLKKVLLVAGVAIALTLGGGYFSVHRAPRTARGSSSPHHATSPRSGPLGPGSRPSTAPAQGVPLPATRPRAAGPLTLGELVLDTAPSGYVELKPGLGPSGSFDLPTFLRSSDDPAHDGAMFSASGFITGFARSWQRQEPRGRAHMVAAVFEFASDDGATAVLDYETKKTLPMCQPVQRRTHRGDDMTTASKDQAWRALCPQDGGVALDVRGGTGMHFVRRAGAGNVYGYDVTFRRPGGRLFYLGAFYSTDQPQDEVLQLAQSQLDRLTRLGAT